MSLSDRLLKWFQTGMVALAAMAVLISIPFALGFLSWSMIGEDPLWQRSLPNLLSRSTLTFIGGMAALFLALALLAGRKGLRGLFSRLGLLTGFVFLAFSVVLLANLDWDPEALLVTFTIEDQPLQARVATLIAALVFSIGAVSVCLSRQPQSLGPRLGPLLVGLASLTGLLAALLLQSTVSGSIGQSGFLEPIANVGLSLAVGVYLLLSALEVLVGDYQVLRNTQGVRDKLRSGLYAALHAGLLLSGMLTGLTLAIAGRDLATLPGSMVITDRRGEVLQVTSVSEERNSYRLKAPLDQVPDSLIHAIVAIEDRSFLTPYHRPVDPIRLASSILSSAEQITSEGTVSRLEGGSTITQQVIKLHTGRVVSSHAAIITSEMPRFIGRPLYLATVLFDKVVIEMPAACVLEMLWSKDDILQYYLNAVYLGDGVYGMETAAQGYFGKSVGDLTPAEATLLAGLPQAPSIFNPRVNMSLARARQGQVLAAMIRCGYLDRDEANLIWSEPPSLTARNALQTVETHHFPLVVREQMFRMLGSRAAAGLKVTSTLDCDLQRTAEKVVRSGVSAFADRKANNAALLAMESDTGFIVAMVGSAKPWDDPVDGQFNVVLAERPAASTFKLFVYVAAYEHGYTPDSIIDDRQRDIAGQHIANWDGRDLGLITLREAFADSRNPPVVELTQELGVATVVEVARRMGITSDLQESKLGPIVGLGACDVRALDLATAYAVVATGGIRREPVFILEAQDWKGHLVHQHKPQPGRRVISQQVAEAIHSSLRMVPEKDGFSTPMGAKTGTTDNFTDAWFAGYSCDLTLVTWMGNTNGERTLEPMDNVWGYDGAGAIWRGFMAAYYGETPRSDVPCAAH
ncbi:MAG: transglycosylase domain-containing protein [Chloroflexota bacterium]